MARDEESRILTRAELARIRALLARIDRGEVGWADMVDDAPPENVGALVTVTQSLKLVR